MKGYDKIYLMNAALAFPVSLDHFLILTMFITSVGYVTMNVEKNLPQEEAQQFPTTIAVNAFRGFLDEYQKRPKKKRPKPKPQKQQAQKANQKKKAKEVSAWCIERYQLLSAVQPRGYIARGSIYIFVLVYLYLNPTWSHPLHRSLIVMKI